MNIAVWEESGRLLPDRVTFHVSIRTVATAMAGFRQPTQLQLFLPCKVVVLAVLYIVTCSVQCGRQDVTSPARRAFHPKTFVFLQCLTASISGKVVRVLLVQCLVSNNAFRFVPLH